MLHVFYTSSYSSRASQSVLWATSFMRYSVKNSILWSNKFEKCCQLNSLRNLWCMLAHQRGIGKCHSKEPILTLSVKCISDVVELIWPWDHSFFTCRKSVNSPHNKNSAALLVNHDLTFPQVILSEIHGIALSASHSSWPWDTFSPEPSLLCLAFLPVPWSYMGPGTVPLL